jgi:hypothetical protein
LFGCPIHEVGQRVPAEEMPYWEIMWHFEPWGFRAQHLGMTDPFKDYDLGEEEFEDLSESEQNDYLNKQIRLMQTVLN